VVTSVERHGILKVIKRLQLYANLGFRLTACEESWKALYPDITFVFH
jgi:hypothetical protein